MKITYIIVHLLYSWKKYPCLRVHKGMHFKVILMLTYVLRDVSLEDLYMPIEISHTCNGICKGNLPYICDVATFKKTTCLMLMCKGVNIP